MSGQGRQATTLPENLSFLSTILLPCDSPFVRHSSLNANPNLTLRTLNTPRIAIRRDYTRRNLLALAWEDVASCCWMP